MGHFDGDLIVIGLTLICGTGMVVLGPIGRALADRLRGKGPSAAVADLEERVEEVAAQLGDLQRHLGEVAERQDFTERLLAQGREPGAPGGGGHT